MSPTRIGLCIPRYAMKRLNFSFSRKNKKTGEFYITPTFNSEELEFTISKLYVGRGIGGYHFSSTSGVRRI